MCYTGGPRCASHVGKELLSVTSSLQKAVNDKDYDRGMKLSEAYKTLRMEYNSTPYGQKLLRTAIEKNERRGETEKAEHNKAILDAAVALREHDMQERRKRLEKGAVAEPSCKSGSESAEEDAAIERMDQEIAKTPATPPVDKSNMTLGEKIKARTKELYKDPHPGKKSDDTVAEECYNCSGTGVYQAYSRIEYNVTDAQGNEATLGCFKCHGAGSSRIKVSSIRARVRREAKSQAENEYRNEIEEQARRHLANKNAEAIKAFTDKHPDVVNGLDSLGSFGASLKEQLNRRGTLSDAQVSAAKQSIERQARRDVEKANRQPVVEGRGRVTGKIVSTKWSDGPYGRTQKMTVMDDRGFKVYGTVPKDSDLSSGMRISLVGTVKASDNDNTFGFFSRPANVEILEKIITDSDEFED